DSGVSHAPRHAAREIIDGFERSARARSERHGWHERDKRARYRHHVRKLKEAVAHASRDLTSEKRAYLAQASATISEGRGITGTSSPSTGRDSMRPVWR